MKTEKLCLFYVNKAHLFIIMKEYLKDKEDYSVTTFFENEIINESEEPNMYELIELNEIDCELTKEPQKKEIKDGKNKIILIDGTDEYRMEVSQYIKEKLKKMNIDNLKIINTYEFEENKLRMSKIFTNNEKILYTVGEEIIEH